MNGFIFEMVLAVVARFGAARLRDRRDMRRIDCAAVSGGDEFAGGGSVVCVRDDGFVGRGRHGRRRNGGAAAVVRVDFGNGFR